MDLIKITYNINKITSFTLIMICRLELPKSPGYVKVTFNAFYLRK